MHHSLGQTPNPKLGVEMVTLVFNTRAKLIIPRHKTLLLPQHAQRTEHPRSRATSTLDPRYATSKSALLHEASTVQHSSSPGLSLRATLHLHAHACTRGSPLAARRELLVDMRRHRHRPLRTRRTRSCQDPVAANDTPVKSTFPMAVSARTAEDRGKSGAP